MTKKIILASASPRRVELLRQIGIEPEVFPVDVEELTQEESPSVLVETNAKKKALEAAKHWPQDVVLGADTVVALGNEVMGKPRSESEAFSMLKFLSGKTHSVFTGVAVVENGTIQAAVVESKVKFFPLSKIEIWDYVATKEPMDKAGAYGIQGKGALLVEEIQGDYNNIVGLPLGVLRRLLVLRDFLPWQNM